MSSVIETGARDLLDPLHKHGPTLLAESVADRRNGSTSWRHAIDIAFSLESDCVLIWSGRLARGPHRDDALPRLAEGLHKVLEHAARERVIIAFEPEPGMLIDTMASYGKLLELVDSPLFKLTLDIGHLHCLGEVPIADQIGQWHPRLANVHLEDMFARYSRASHVRRGRNRFPARDGGARKEVAYSGPVNVELSRHSHLGPEAAQRAFEFLKPMTDSDI